MAMIRPEHLSDYISVYHLYVLLSCSFNAKSSQIYQQELFQELRAHDELVVIARGLGLLHLVTNLLYAFASARNSLIILVGASERENSWIGEALSELSASSKTQSGQILQKVDDRVGATSRYEFLWSSLTDSLREEKYRQGGVFSITSRILITDLLSGEQLPSIKHD